MEGSAFGSELLATIQRPVLPPLPPGLRAGNVASTANTGVTGAPMGQAQQSLQAVPTATSSPAHAPAQAAIHGVTRPSLPKTPPELTGAPVVSAAGPAATATPIVASTGLASPAAESVASVASDTEASLFPKMDTPEAESRLSRFKRGGSSDAEKTSKKTPKDKIKRKGVKKTKLKGSASSNLKPAVAILAVLALVGVAIFFGRGLLEGTAIVSQLESGECVENFFDDGDSGSFVEILAVSTVECSQPHAYEVFAVNDALFSDPAYPGVEASFATGQQYCLTEYETFIGGSRENLTTWDVWTFVPPEASWSGDRVVHCLVGDFNETTPTTGSLAGIAGG